MEMQARIRRLTTVKMLYQSARIREAILLSQMVLQTGSSHTRFYALFMRGPLWMGSNGQPASIQHCASGSRLAVAREERAEKQSRVWPWHVPFQHRCHHPSRSCHRVPPAQLQGWLGTSVYSTGPGRGPSVWHHPCHSGQQCPAHSWLLIYTS